MKPRPPLQRNLLLACSLLLLLGLAPPAPGEDWEYIVQPGDNLWDLSRDYLVSMDYWRKLQRLNRVTEPRRMPPGMRLRIPRSWLRANEARVRVLAVYGQPRLTAAGSGRTETLVAGSELQSGDLVRTGEDETLTLEFGDGSRLLLQGGSELLLESAESYGVRGNRSTQLRLNKGRVDTQVQPQKPGGGRFEIRTPAAISSVRGTSFRIGAGDATMRAEALEGLVEIGGQGRSVALARGFGTTADADRGPRQPVPLLPAPDLSGIPAQIDASADRIPVPPLPGAAGYRWQWFDRGDFSSLLAEGTSPGSEVPLPDLEPGPYWLRVRAIDAQGLEGFDASRELHIRPTPEPSAAPARVPAPQPLAPPPGSLPAGAAPWFRWTEPDGARGYRFELARDPGFRILVLSAEQEASALRLGTDLIPGPYFWRVAAFDAAGERGEFCPPRELQLAAGSSGRRP